MATHVRAGTLSFHRILSNANLFLAFEAFPSSVTESPLSPSSSQSHLPPLSCPPATSCSHRGFSAQEDQARPCLIKNRTDCLWSFGWDELYDKEFSYLTSHNEWNHITTAAHKSHGMHFCQQDNPRAQPAPLWEPHTHQGGTFLGVSVFWKPLNTV